MSDTECAAMAAQAAFENNRGEPNHTLYQWLSAEIAHARAVGLEVDMNQLPQQIETPEDADMCLRAVRNLSSKRQLHSMSLFKVA